MTAHKLLGSSTPLLFFSFSLLTLIPIATTTTAYAQQPANSVTLDNRLEISNETEKFVEDYLARLLAEKLTNSMHIQVRPNGAMLLYSDSNTPADPRDDISIVIGKTGMSVDNGFQFRDNAVYAPNGSRVLPAVQAQPSLQQPQNSINTDNYDGTPDADD